MPKNNLSKFPWAINPYKLEKAIENVGDKDEERTKAEYQRLGGLVRNPVARQFVAPKPLYPWAANKSKLDRAILKANQVLNTDGKPEVNEESIKAQYISLGGLVLKNDESTSESAVVAPKAKKVKPADED